MTSPTKNSSDSLNNEEHGEFKTQQQHHHEHQPKEEQGPLVEVMFSQSYNFNGMLDYRQPTDIQNPIKMELSAQNTVLSSDNVEIPNNVELVDGVPRIIGGRKRALLIGIQYTDTDAQLSSCHDDTKMIKKLLEDMYGFPTDPGSMKILIDDVNVSDPDTQPLKKTIMSAMRWLVEGAKSGDSLVFFYSGHGQEIRDSSGDEKDGKDSVILPLDFKKSGYIVDDQIQEIMISGLPEGVRFTALMDCCHSGTALDLPYDHINHNKSKGRIAAAEAAAKTADLGVDTPKNNNNDNNNNNSGDGAKRFNNALFDIFKRVKYKRFMSRRSNEFKADVVCFSGSSDSQISYVTEINWVRGGALTLAFNESLRNNPQQSSVQLLHSIRTFLSEHSTQTPQLSGINVTALNQMFAL